MDEDELYIRKVCEGDTEVFRYLLRKYKDMAFTLASSIVKDQFDAEEVVQDAFLKVFHSLKNFKKDGKFSTWFYRIVINEAFQKLRKNKNNHITYTDELIHEAIIENRSFQLSEDEQKRYINKALEKLSPSESLALRLHYLQGACINEICQMTGWSTSKVKVTLHRGRKSLKSILKRFSNTEKE